MKKNRNLRHVNLTFNNSEAIEKKRKSDRMMKEKVMHYWNFEQYMRGAFMAAEAEIEMVKYKIDLITAGFVSDFYKQNEKPENYKEFFSWS